MKLNKPPISSKLVVLLSLGIISISTTAQSIKNIRSGVPEGFTPLPLPREQIPIGARWIPGIGPDGEGVNFSNRTITKSVSKLTSDSDLGYGVQLSILRFLELSGNNRSSIKVEASNLTIESVGSLEETTISSNQSLLYEGLKAESITIVYDEALDATVRGSIEEKGIPITFDGGAVRANSIIIDGSNLFIGYRVVELVPGKVKRNRKKMSREGEVTIKPYDLKLDTWNAKMCLCKESRGVRIESTDQCNDTIHVVDYNRSSMGGTIFQKEFELSGITPQRVTLGNSVSGNEVSVDSLIVRSILRLGNTHPPMPCLIEIERGDSYIELVRSSFKIENMDISATPGWK
ncbi:MAG: hypothetical protein V4628_08305 [Pseudomonadota bacterium]